MKATDAYRKINNSPIKGIVLYYTEKILQMEKVDLGSVISQIQTGKTPPKANHKYYSTPDVNWFKPSDIGYDKYLEKANEKFSNIAVKEKKATIYPKDTLLLIGIGGGVGRVSILKEEGSSNQQITGISFNEEVCSQYAYYYYLVREDYIKSQAKSMSFPILNQSKIKELEFKYPTINEQNEFVKFIDACWNSFLNNQIPDVSVFEISAELKEYALKQFKAIELDDKIQKNIDNELTLLSNLKQSILQEAIQGKLTAGWRAQNPITEPASELLKHIKEEKEQLIKDKKIKKEKALPPITEEEIPFDLPEGWVWCRIQDISSLKSGNSYKYSVGSVRDIPYVKVGDMNIPGNFNDVLKSSNYFVYQDSMEKDLIKPKSIIFPKRGGAIATNKRCNVLSKKILIDSNSMAIIPSELIDFDFFSWWFKTIDLSTFGNEAVVPQVNNKDILPIPFRLPPLNEQKAIVEKVESLMQKCQALEEEIKTSEANAQMLMQAVLKEAFEGEKEVVC